jgi:hypothetical protein
MCILPPLAPILPEHYTLQSAPDKFDVIECFEHPGQRLRVGEILEKQRKIHEAMDVQPPASL